ncbi:MAG: DUF1080 domain-containing protein [bacterium]|nr:DUF1080 domain-containing protein [bacterium]
MCTRTIRTISTAVAALTLGWSASAQEASSSKSKTGTAEGDDKSAGRTWNFDDESADKVPAGWSIRETKPTERPATWKVVADETAPSKPNVLALTETKNGSGTFNLAIADKTAFKDLDLTVKVEAVSGFEDQGGGPIWRCRDENNYYVCRFNPLESNYRVYKVVDGQRKKLASAKVETVAGQWYTVRVTMIGDRIACYLDGKKLLEATDDALTDPGMVGLWTKADAATRFDDLSVQAVEQ